MRHEEEAEEPRRKVVVEAPRDGRGGQTEPTARALTLAEKLYSADVLTYDEWQAAGALRNMHFLLIAPSEGVSSYGLSTGQAEPTRKGDRKAQRLTGIEILLNGQVHRGPSRSNRSDIWRYRDALFAMCGCHDDEGRRMVDVEAAQIMLRSVCDSEAMPTQTEIGRMRASYIKDNGKKVSPPLSAAGAFFVKEYLRRLTIHFRMVKAGEVK